MTCCEFPDSLIRDAYAFKGAMEQGYTFHTSHGERITDYRAFKQKEQRAVGMRFVDTEVILELTAIPPPPPEELRGRERTARAYISRNGKLLCACRAGQLAWAFPITYTPLPGAPVPSGAIPWDAPNFTRSAPLHHWRTLPDLWPGGWKQQRIQRHETALMDPLAGNPPHTWRLELLPGWIVGDDGLIRQGAYQQKAYSKNRRDHDMRLRRPKHAHPINGRQKRDAPQHITRVLRFRCPACRALVTADLCALNVSSIAPEAGINEQSARERLRRERENAATLKAGCR